MSDLERGDIVRHVPSGEEWLLLRVKDDYVYPAGWPPSRALAADCVLVSKATPDTLALLAPLRPPREMPR